MLKKTIQYIGLRDFDYDIVDTSPYSDKYFNIIELPDVLTGGKNLIRLLPKTDNLKPGSPIYIEIIDSNGRPIYNEVLNYIGSDKSRAISVYIYPDTAPGTAVIYIASTSNDSDIGVQTPPNSLPNIMWQTSIMVSPISRNKSEILFETQPVVLVSEKIVRYHEPDNDLLVGDGINGYSREAKKSSSIATATVEMISNLKSEDAVSNTRYSKLLRESQFDTSLRLNTQTIPSASITTDLFDTDSETGARSGRYINIPPAGNNVIFSKQFAFTSDMEGGMIYIRNANVSNYIPTDVPDPTIFNPVPTTYSSSITRVINSSSIEVYDPFLYSFTYTASNGIAKTVTIDRFNATTNFTCSYINSTWTESETMVSKSYAECIFTNIAPMSGDIFKIKTYYKPMGMYGDFIDNGETVITEYNILRNVTHYTQSISDGMVELEFSRLRADNYSTYLTSSIENISDPLADTTVSMSFCNDNLIDGIKLRITGSGTYTNESYYTLETKARMFPKVFANTDYAIDFNAYCEDNTLAVSTTYPQPRVDVYLDNHFSYPGSPNVIVDDSNNKLSFDVVSKLVNYTYIGSLVGTSGHRFDDIRMKFRSVVDQRIRPIFVIRSGTWTFNHIKINVVRENGFSPNYVRLLSYIPSVASDTELIFKFQYFNYDGRQAATETLVYGVRFDGNSATLPGGGLTGTTVIEGDIDLDGIVMAATPLTGYTTIRGATALVAGTGGGP